MFLNLQNSVLQWNYKCHLTFHYLANILFPHDFAWTSNPVVICLQGDLCNTGYLGDGEERCEEVTIDTTIPEDITVRKLSKCREGGLP